MLLSRETALDKETKERLRLQEELKNLEAKAGSEEIEKVKQFKAENEKLKVSGLLKLKKLKQPKLINKLCYFSSLRSSL